MLNERIKKKKWKQEREKSRNEIINFTGTSDDEYRLLFYHYCRFGEWLCLYSSAGDFLGSINKTEYKQVKKLLNKVNKYGGIKV